MATLCGAALDEARTRSDHLRESPGCVPWGGCQLKEDEITIDGLRQAFDQFKAKVGPIVKPRTDKAEDLIWSRNKQNGDEDGQVEHFKAVAASIELGIVIHGNPSLKLIERLIALDSVVAMKEEFPYDFTLQVYRKFGDRLNIFAGGTKPRFLVYQPYGMQAYYSAFATVAPQIAMQFWSAVQKNDLNEARRIIIQYDLPFFERWSQPFWRATLEYFGVAKRYLRPPEKGSNDSQLQEVKTFYDGLGLKPVRT